MNDNAQKWVAALRSGEYAQNTEAFLHIAADPANNQPVDRFCCLGVACKLAVEAGVIPSPNTQQDYPGSLTVYQYGAAGETGNASALPPDVRDWLGLNDNLGHRAGGDGLASMNDNGVTFEVIADLIEREPDGLFSS